MKPTCNKQKQMLTAQMMIIQKQIAVRHLQQIDTMLDSTATGI